MEFEITDGTGEISIGYWNSGEYLKICKLISLVMEEVCMGADLEYSCTFKPSYKINKLINNGIGKDLYEDYKGREQLLLDRLTEVLKLFDNGKYQIDFFDDIRNTDPEFLFRKKNGENLERSWYVVQSGKTIDPENPYELWQEYQEYFTEKRKFKEFVCDFVEYKTGYFYSHSPSFPLIATISSNDIDKEKITFFENEISSGKRPFAVLFCNNYYENVALTDGDLVRDYFHGWYYILDGHHKLKAYENLNMIPPVLVIKCEDKLLSKLNLQFNDLLDCALPEYLTQIFTHWWEKEVQLVEYFKNHNNNERKLKDGTYSLYYKNGQKFYEANFTNEVFDGDEKAWYDTGAILFHNIYNKGLRVGEWKSWYSGGQLKTKVLYGNEGSQLSLTRYFEDGKKWFSEDYKVDNHKYANRRTTTSAKADRKSKISVSQNKMLIKTIIAIVLGLLWLIIIIDRFFK